MHQFGRRLRHDRHDLRSASHQRSRNVDRTHARDASTYSQSDTGSVHGRVDGADDIDRRMLSDRCNHCIKHHTRSGKSQLAFRRRDRPVGAWSDTAPTDSLIYDAPASCYRRNMKRHAMLLALLLLCSSSTESQPAWSFTTGGAIPGRPAVAGGVAYVPSEDRHLYALEVESGKMLWRTYVEDRPNGSLSVGPDGTIYLGTRRGWLVAVNPGGMEIWRVRLEAAIVGDPAVAFDGTIYVSAEDGTLHAFSHLGEHRFERSLPARPSDGPTLSAAGTILVPSVDRNVYAFDSVGKRMWNVVLAGVPSRAAARSKGGFVVATDYGSVVAISARGAILWDYIESGGFLPVVLFGGEAVALTYGGTALRIDVEGSVVWRRETGADFVGYPVCDSSGWVVAETAGGALLRVGPGGVVGDPLILVGGSAGAVMADDGTVVVGSNDWSVYGFRSKTVPAGDWSQVGKDSRHNSSRDIALTERKMRDSYAGDPDFLFLDALLASDGHDQWETVLSVIASLLGEAGSTGRYRYLRWFLERLMAEGTMRVDVAAGAGADRPDIRARAAELIAPVAGIRTNAFIAGLLKYEYDVSATAAMMRAAGRIGSDPDGAMTRAIARIVAAGAGSAVGFDGLLGSAAVEGLAGIIRYHGTPTDSAGMDALLGILRGDYPRSVRQAALDAMRSIRYY